MNTGDEGPTIASLAAELFDGRSELPYKLPLLRAGTQAPPLFLSHGLGDNVLDLLALARSISLPVPVYGLQAPGLNGSDAPIDRIEKLADFFLTAMQQVQPSGPYFLVGYSVGGLVVREIAQRLKTKKEAVGLLMMLDTWPARHYLPVWQRSALLWRAALRRLSDLAGGSRAHLNSSSHDAAGWEAGRLELLRLRKEADQRAWYHYKPTFYDGPVHFVRASVRTYFPNDPLPFWEHLSSGFEVESVPGNHMAMLKSQKETVAAVIDRSLRAAHSRT